MPNIIRKISYEEYVLLTTFECKDLVDDIYNSVKHIMRPKLDEIYKTPDKILEYGIALTLKTVNDGYGKIGQYYCEFVCYYDTCDSIEDVLKWQTVMLYTLEYYNNPHQIASRNLPKHFESINEGVTNVE